MKKLLQITNNFTGKKIGVIGDLMLDHFILGEVERISSEAPVPIVLVQKEIFIPGGAGNTASNAASLGGEVFVFGTVGRDLAGRQLLGELKNRGIDTRGLIKNSNPTIQKCRVSAHGQQIVRFDKENNAYIDKNTEDKLLGLISSRMKHLDALIISDYAKMTNTKRLTQNIIHLAKKYKKLIVGDTKPKHINFFKGVYILTPNKKEIEEMVGQNATSEKELEKIGKILQKRLGSHILITRGSEGMSLFEGRKISHLPSNAKELFDVTGAGDTVVAALTMALAAGANLREAMEISNFAAGIVVAEHGTASVGLEELQEELRNAD